MSNCALFRFYCEATPDSTTSCDSSSSDSSENYDDSATSTDTTTTTTTTTTEATDEAVHSGIMCQVTVEDVPEQENDKRKRRTQSKCSERLSARGQLMELLFDIYCLLNGFFRSLLDSNCPVIQGKCKQKESADETAILDILQRIVDREILVNEKCRKYPALIPMLTAINRKFQAAEGLFTNMVEETTNRDVLGAIVESVENIQNYFECMKVTNGTEKEVESDLKEILCYIDYPLSSAVKKGVQSKADCRELNKQLGNWLERADLNYGPARAIISPHAGYSYCGDNAGWGFRQISPAVVKRIFVLGPSHYVRLKACALSQCEVYKTPLYDLKVDRAINRELRETNQFQWMDLKTDEDEHSIEMQMPFIAKVMEDFRDQFTIVPIMVGSLSYEAEQKYGEILAPYLAEPENLFVISSDFCHWGDRFRYTYSEKACGPIYKSIEKLDKAGMDLIETLKPQPFCEYMQRYNNTICGRHPIGVFLQCCDKLREHGHRMSFRFLKYSQSSQVTEPSDSSVSYASGALIFE